MTKRGEIALDGPERAAEYEANDALAEETRGSSFVRDPCGPCMAMLPKSRTRAMYGGCVRSTQVVGRPEMDRADFMDAKDSINVVLVGGSLAQQSSVDIYLIV